MRVIEGTVDEIVEYQRLLGSVPTSMDALAVANGEAPAEEPPPAKRATALGDDPDGFFVKQFVYKRAHDGASARRVLEFLERSLALGTVVEVGESERSNDGYTPYLMVRDAGPRRFGAVAYVSPSNAGLTLRLRPEDVEDMADEHVKGRKVAERQPYAVICPLRDDEAVEVAVRLVDRALAKVRGDA